MRSKVNKNCDDKFEREHELAATHMAKVFVKELAHVCCEQIQLLDILTKAKKKKIPSLFEVVDVL